MSSFVVSIFADEAKAYEAARVFKSLHDEGSISVYDTIVVHRQHGGWLEIEKQGSTAIARTGIGMLVGALIGVFGGPAGVAAGAVAGIAVGCRAALVRSDVSDEFLEDISRTMVPGDYAVLAEVSDAWTTPMDLRLQALGGSVMREKRADYVDGLIEKRAEAFKAEVEEHDTERASRTAMRTGARTDDHILEVRERFQRMANRARDRLDNTRAEMQRKLDALEAQARVARPAVKKQIEQRIADIRKDFSERERKLSRAFEIADRALRP